MNPNQPLGNSGTGGTATPPETSPPANTGYARDLPEDGFGFTDDQPSLPQVVRPPTPIQPQPGAVVPQVTIQPTPIAAPAPTLTPLQPQPQPQPQPPAAIMPPQQVPDVPTLQQPVAQPAATPAIQPVQPVASAQAAPVQPTATFSPQSSMSHLPDDIANRINEKPMQNSGDIMRQIKHGLDGNRVKSVLSFIVFIVSIFAAAFLINQYIFQSYYVEGTSMTPTLQNNDRLIISKVERTIANVQGKPYIPERGQIVVLDSSIVGLNGQHEQLIKRVVGLPGDRVHIEAGTVTITNAAHPDGFDVTKSLGLTNLHATYTDEPIDLAIPEGHVYVMGDNREQGGSYDSRAFGPIEGNQIQGRLWGRILPIDKAQLF